MQCIGVGDAAEIVEIGQFPPHIVLRHERAARVCAKTDRNAFFKRSSCACNDPTQNDARVVAVHGPYMGLMDVQKRQRQDR